MSEEKPCASGSGCTKTECIQNWFKVVDDFSIAGLKNKLPRLYYLVGVLVILAYLTI
jgi:hypothetical protein